MKKKIVLALVVLMFTAPAFAAVTISCVNEGGGVVAIKYSVSGEASRIRAFALDFSVDSGTITDITDFNVGECNSLKKGYGIFMGSIMIDEQGNVTDYNNPVAPPDAPDDPCQLGSDKITVEMGSLYVDSNFPADSGTLFKLHITPTKKCCYLTINTNALRGGIILENGKGSEDIASPLVVTAPGKGADYPFVVADCPRLGDFNKDGYISPGDMSEVVQFLQKNSNAFPKFWVVYPEDPNFDICYDVGGDGYISPQDISDILGYLQNNSNMFPLFWNIPEFPGSSTPGYNHPYCDPNWPPE